MKAKKVSAFLLAALLMSQVFCIPAIAAGEPEATIAYDRAAGTVNVKAFGFEAGSMVSLTGYYDGGLDYLNQYTAGASGNLDVTYPSSKGWAEGGIIKVVVGAGGLPEPIVETVTISSGPYIKGYTSSLTAGYPANILVAAGNPLVAGLSAEVTVNGKIYSAAFNGNESTIIKVTEVINEAELTLRLTSGGELLDSKPIAVNTMPIDIWSPRAEAYGSGFRVIFAANISESVKGYAGTINGAAVAPVQVGSAVLVFEYAELLDNNKLVISGVKYPDYFPSYSFTFSLSF